MHKQHTHDNAPEYIIDSISLYDGYLVDCDVRSAVLLSPNKTHRYYKSSSRNAHEAETAAAAYERRAQSSRVDVTELAAALR
eukprot:scaffold567489_cov20-Prasinocladus_malaysianus.AAC.1